MTSVIGSGGKTSLLAVLAHELPGTVVLTTTTHILPFPDVPLVASADVDDVQAALAESRVVCAGSQAEKNGKLVTPELDIDALASLADYVLVEADGARRLPLKAHAAWEAGHPRVLGPHNPRSRRLRPRPSRAREGPPPETLLRARRLRAGRPHNA